MSADDVRAAVRFSAADGLQDPRSIPLGRTSMSTPSWREKAGQAV